MLRGHQEETISLFSYVSIEEMIPARYPLRQIRSLATEALQRLDRTPEKLYACAGRPSIRPEQLLLALLLQAICSLRSERLLVAWPGFFGKRFSNSTHPSSQDPDARLARRSPSHPALLSFLGHVLMDHRYHLVADSRLTLADGYGERAAAQQMVADLKGKHPKTISADKGYDTKGRVGFMR